MEATTPGLPFPDFPHEFKGPIYRPHDFHFQSSRQIWNSRLASDQPAMIVRPLDSDDVVTAVRYADARDIPLAIKGGGHGIDALAMAPDALVIDFSRMTGRRVDPETGICTVQAGVTLGDLDTATQEHGLVVPAGVVTRTGVAGLTLGGGIGNSTRRFGATVDSLLSVEMVTMDGRKITVSEKQEPELFWGLRGAGHNLGVVTEFTFQGHKAGPDVIAGLMFFDQSAIEPVISRVDAFMSAAPRTLTLALLILPAPPMPQLPPETIGKPILCVMVVYTGALDKFEEGMADFRALATPLFDDVRQRKWVQANSIVDSFEPEGRRQHMVGGYTANLSAELGRVALQLIAASPPPTGPGPTCFINFPALGGRMLEPNEDATAFSRAGAEWLFEARAQWDGEENDAAYVKWISDTEAAVAPFLNKNAYINLSGHRGAAWLRAAYGGPEKWNKLVGLKRKWDPKNLLRFNKNIIEAEDA